MLRKSSWIEGGNPFGWVLMATMTIRLVTLGLYPLMDTTEARYAEMARKMVETGNWLTPQFEYGVPFWGKPPLSIWLTAGSFKWLGINEFSSRLPSLFVTILIIGLTFHLAYHQRGTRFAIAASTILATTGLVFILAGAVLMDPVMALGTTLVMVGFWRVVNDDERVWGYLFFLGLAIGLLAKGPVAVVLVVIPISLWVIVEKKWALLKRLPITAGMVLLLALVLPWYLLAERATPGFLEYFFIGEHWRRFIDPGWTGDLYGKAHQQPFGMIWLQWIVVALPWSLVLLAGGVRAVWNKGLRSLAIIRSGWPFFLLLWCITPMLFFTFSSNILSTYVLPGMPAMALLLAELWQNNRSPKKSIAGLAAIGLAVPVLCLIAVIFYLPSHGAWKSEKYLIDQYHRLNSSGDSRLIYVGKRPFSAEFYSSGKALNISDSEEMIQSLEKGNEDFFVLRTRTAETLPKAVHMQLEPMGTFGRSVLLKARK